MRKKGFTLVELLAVIVLLSILVMLVIPSITGSLKKQENETDALMLDMIEKAANLYIEDDGSFIDRDGNAYCIAISYLVEKGYLKDNVKYDGVDITNSKSIQVIYDDGINFKLLDNDKCETNRTICKAVTEENKTTGNVPTGNFNPGDEYICEVKEDVYYNFFVLDEDYNDSTKVSLILESNINKFGKLVKDDSMSDKGNVNWISETDFYATNGVAQDVILESSCCKDYNLCTDTTQGPVTAMHYLSVATSSWNNLENVVMNYDSELLGVYNQILTENNVTTIINKYGNESAQYENLKARLPIISELENTGCGYQDEGEHWQAVTAKCPLYMINYTLNTEGIMAVEKYKSKVNISDLYGYWSFFSENASAKVITFDGKISYDGINFGNSMGDDTTIFFSTNSFGVRPVISVSKKYIKS